MFAYFCRNVRYEKCKSYVGYCVDLAYTSQKFDVPSNNAHAAKDDGVDIKIFIFLIHEIYV